ncbi:MAG: acetate uptake transporter [Solirubrobacteraceae bacterium]
MSTSVKAETPLVVSSSPAPAAAAVAANAVPMGLLCFAVVTFVVSIISANLVGGPALPILFGAALTVGGIAHFICGTVELRNGNTFTGCLFNAYGGFWMSFWALNAFYAKDIPAAEAGSALGLYLLCWAGVTFCFFAAALVLPKAIPLTLGLLTITFILLGVGYAGSHTDVIHAGGYFGMATAISAAYVGLAQIMEATWGRAVLPTG